MEPVKPVNGQDEPDAIRYAAASARRVSLKPLLIALASVLSLIGALWCLDSNVRWQQPPQVCARCFCRADAETLNVFGWPIVLRRRVHRTAASLAVQACDGHACQTHEWTPPVCSSSKGFFGWSRELGGDACPGLLLITDAEWSSSPYRDVLLDWLCSDPDFRARLSSAVREWDSDAEEELRDELWQAADELAEQRHAAQPTSQAEENGRR